MKYEDRIYGKLRIDEPVVLEIIQSKAFQRLKGIDQAGYWKPFFLGKPINRLQHSVGVYLLLKKFQASLEEQISGLIHDVSHAAFSHCIDYALAEGSPEHHDHQDKVFKSFVRQSEIPKILKKYGFNPNLILDDRNFPLKEKEIPDLCADRIDYSLRTAVHIGEIKVNWVKKLLKSLRVINNQWVFNNQESAAKFACLFLKLNRKYYSGFKSALMFAGVGDWLSYSLSKRYINYADLYTTDKQVIQKISKYNKMDKKLALLWSRVNNKIPTRNNPEGYNRKVVVKSRIIDPLFKNSIGEIIRLSAIDKDWKDIVKKELEPKEYYLQYLKNKS